MTPTVDTSCLTDFEYTVCWNGYEFPSNAWEDWDIDIFSRTRNEVRSVSGIVGYKYNAYEPKIKGTFLFPCLENLVLLFPDLVDTAGCNRLLFGSGECVDIATTEGPLVLKPKCATNDAKDITLFNASINVDGSVSGGEGECWKLSVEWSGIRAPARLPNGNPHPYAGITHALGTLDCTQESIWNCATQATEAV